MIKRMKSALEHFWAQDDGSVTVDWVVLLSGILGMTFLVMGTISGGVSTFGTKAGEELASREVGFF